MYSCVLDCGDVMIKRHKALIKAILVSILFVSISGWVGFHWELNDDPAFAFLLSRYNNDYSPFQGRVLSIVLHFLYVNLPIIDWWAVTSVFAIWLSALVCLYLIYRRYPEPCAGCISCVMLTILWIVAFMHMNFTRTAIAVAIAGALLTADGVLLGKTGKINFVKLVIGCFLLLFGGSIRRQCALIALGFLAVIALTRFLADHFSISVEWIKEHIAQGVSLCLVALIVFGASSVRQLMLTPAQKAYEKYNQIRSAIQDYKNNYPSFYEAEKEYLEAGMDLSDYDMFFFYFSEDTDNLSEDELEAVTKLKEEKRSLSELPGALRDNRELLQIAVILIILLVLTNWKKILHMLGPVVLAVICCIYLAWEGRFPSRVLATIVLSTVFSLLFVMGDDEPSRNHLFGQFTSIIRSGSITWKKAYTMLLTVVYVVAALLSLDLIKNDLIYNKTYLTPTESINERHKNVLDVIDKDDDRIYLFDIIAVPASMSSAFSFWEAKPTEYCENYFYLGGWDARHPYYVALLEQQGITNPTRALFEHPAVCTTYSPRILNYLQCKYNSRITASKIDVLNGMSIIQYSAPVDDSVIGESADTTVQINEFHYSDANSIDSWYISADVNADKAEDGVFYCSVTVNGARRTFRLKHEGDILSAYFLGLKQDFNVENADVRIFEMTDEGYFECNLIAPIV